MGILDLLFYRDPSRDWPPHTRTEWDLRWDTGILNGTFRTGAPAADLKALGKPDNRQPHKVGVFAYHASGIEFDVEDGKIVGYLFVFRDEYRPLFQETSLMLGSARASRTRVTSRSQPNDLVRILGEPSDRDDDPEDIVLYWSAPRWSLDANFSPKTGLTQICYFLEGDSNTE